MNTYMDSRPPFPIPAPELGTAALQHRHLQHRDQHRDPHQPQQQQERGGLELACLQGLTATAFLPMQAFTAMQAADLATTRGPDLEARIAGTWALQPGTPAWKAAHAHVAGELGGLQTMLDDLSAQMRAIAAEVAEYRYKARLNALNARLAVAWYERRDAREREEGRRK